MDTPGIARAVTALTVGHVTHDRFDGRTRAGGSAFYGSKTMRALGARSRLVSTVGVDFMCHAELSDLEILLNVRGSTTCFENSYSSDGARRQRVSAVGPAVAPRSLPADWRKADVLFLAPVIGEVDAAIWVDAVEAPFIGLGLQGFLKTMGLGESVTCRPLTLPPDVFERTSVVFLSEEDLSELGGFATDLLARLRRTVPIVVLTAGASGSRVFSHAGECRVGTFPAVATDPTGAGDVFAATFLVALTEGARPDEAAVLASAAASIVIEGEGGIALERVGECRARATAVPFELGC